MEENHDTEKDKVVFVFHVTECVLISDCGAAVKTNPSPVPSPIASAAQLMESPTPIETKTPIATPTATLSPTGIEYHCINISEDVAKLSNIGGTLVLNGFLDPGAKNNPNVVIVDLVQERANIIKTGYEPIGWMN